MVANILNLWLVLVQRYESFCANGDSRVDVGAKAEAVPSASDNDQGIILKSDNFDQKDKRKRQKREKGRDKKERGRKREKRYK